MTLTEQIITIGMVVLGTIIHVFCRFFVPSRETCA